MKKFFIAIMLFCFFQSITAQEDKNANTKATGVDNTVSTIVYTQENQEKHFVGKLKFPIEKLNILFNITMETSEISDGIGPVGILDLFDISDTSLSSGAKVSAGITFTNYYKKIRNAANNETLNKKLIEIEKYLKNVKKGFDPEDIPKEMPIYWTFKRKVYELEKNVLIELKKDLNKIERIDWQDKKALFEANTLNKILEVMEKEIERCEDQYIEEIVRIYAKAKSENEAITSEVFANLVQNINREDLKRIAMYLSDETNKSLEKIYDKIVLGSGIWLFSVNGGVDHTELDYLDTQKAFEKKTDSFLGGFINLQFGYMPDLKRLWGISLEHGKVGKSPELETIIQEFKNDGISFIPQTWKSQEVFLSGLKINYKTKLLFEYRRHISKSFALNPFIEMAWVDNIFKNYSIACNLYAMLDKEKKWSIGIQPFYSKLKNKDNVWEAFKIGIVFNLSTAFELL